MPDYPGKDPHLTSFLWGTVVFCNSPETANMHVAVKALRVSYWFAMLIAAIPLFPLAIATLRRFRRFRRRRMNACPHCGYNLTGNESGVCPECATPVPEQETTA